MVTALFPEYSWMDRRARPLRYCLSAVGAAEHIAASFLVRSLLLLLLLLLNPYCSIMFCATPRPRPCHAALCCAVLHSSREERCAALSSLISWEDPGPGGFYDQLGAEANTPYS